MFNAGGFGGPLNSVFGGGYEGSYGGGGFLSQPETSEAGSRYGANNSSIGGRTNANTDGLHMFPFTVSLIKKSFQRNPQISHSDFFGEEVKHVFLVGLVLNLDIDESSEKWTFKLDDGTGSILVEWCVADCRSYDEAGPSAWVQERLERIRAGAYVAVLGGVNMLGKDEPAIRAYNVKRVAVAEQIFSHQIHVVQEIVRRQHPEGPPVLDDARTSPKTGDAARIGNRLSTNEYNNSGDRSFNPSPASRFNQQSFNPSEASRFGGQQQQQQPRLSTSYSTQAPPPSSAPLSSSGNFPPQQQQQSDSADSAAAAASQAVMTVLNNSTKTKPQGLTPNEIVFGVNLLTGIELDLPQLQHICRLLVNQSRVYESEGGRWKLTNF